MQGAQPSKQLVAVHAGHIDVTDHQAERLAGDRQQGILGATDRTVRAAAQLKGVAQGLAQGAVILDQQYFDFCACRFHRPYSCVANNGSVTMAQVPRPRRERNRNSP